MALLIKKKIKTGVYFSSLIIGFVAAFAVIHAWPIERNQLYILYSMKELFIVPSFLTGVWLYQFDNPVVEKLGDAICRFSLIALGAAGATLILIMAN